MALHGMGGGRGCEHSCAPVAKAKMSIHSVSGSRVSPVVALHRAADSRVALIAGRHKYSCRALNREKKPCRARRYSSRTRENSSSSDLQHRTKKKKKKKKKKEKKKKKKKREGIEKGTTTKKKEKGGKKEKGRKEKEVRKKQRRKWLKIVHSYSSPRLAGLPIGGCCLPNLSRDTSSSSCGSALSSNASPVEARKSNTLAWRPSAADTMAGWKPCSLASAATAPRAYRYLTTGS
jgi:hypothetical protein